MSWTTAQKTNLNNSMSAAQDVSLGTLIDTLASASATDSTAISALQVATASLVSASAAGLKMRFGTAVPTGSSYTVTGSSTGLTSIQWATVHISGSPIATHTSSTAFTSSGSIIVKNWVISGSVVTPASSTYADVNWIAFGT